MSLFEDYLKKLPTKQALRGAKRIILKRLWHTDSTPFPKPWVSSEELLEITGQKYFDRRARELRSDLGCDIESAYQTEFSGHGWRLKSDYLTAAMAREYLTAEQRALLFSSHKNACAACGKVVEGGVRGLQADHKIPLSRGGGSESTNWQPLCHNCNVGKRRACEGCTLSCKSCSWAFPELVGVPIILNIPEDQLRAIQQIAAKKRKTVNAIIEEAVKNLIEKG